MSRAGKRASEERFSVRVPAEMLEANGGKAARAARTPLPWLFLAANSAHIPYTVVAIVSFTLVPTCFADITHNSVWLVSCEKHVQTTFEQLYHD